MADLPAQDPIRPDLSVRIDRLDVFVEVAITNPTELAAFYLPTPKNLVVQVDQAIPAPPDLNGPPNR